MHQLQSIFYQELLIMIMVNFLYVITVTGTNNKKQINIKQYVLRFAQNLNNFEVGIFNKIIS